MHTLNFKRQFVDKIKRGHKCQTVRKTRVRPIKAGDTLRLYTGMRTKNCELIKEVVCTEVKEIEIYLDLLLEKAIILDGKGVFLRDEIEDFAKKDGFSDSEEMFLFFFKDYRKAQVGFDGHLIKWCEPCLENNSGVDL